MHLYKFNPTKKDRGYNVCLTYLQYEYANRHLAMKCIDTIFFHQKF